MIDDEEVENMFAGAKQIKDVLGLEIDQYERYRKGVIKGLVKFGGSFAYHLGLLLQVADLPHSIRILSVWQKECVEHEMLYRIWKAKQDAGATAT